MFLVGVGVGLVVGLMWRDILGWLAYGKEQGEDPRKPW